VPRLLGARYQRLTALGVAAARRFNIPLGGF
jgi:hypothetical protein